MVFTVFFENQTINQSQRHAQNTGCNQLFGTLLRGKKTSSANDLIDKGKPL